MSRAEERLRLVDGVEVDVADGRVALDSPVGRALLGRRLGDQVTVRTPAGERMLTIVDVQPYRPS